MGCFLQAVHQQESRNDKKCFNGEEACSKIFGCAKEDYFKMKTCNTQCKKAFEAVNFRKILFNFCHCCTVSILGPDFTFSCRDWLFLQMYRFLPIRCVWSGNGYAGVYSFSRYAVACDAKGCIVDRMEAKGWGRLCYDCYF